MRKAGSQTCVKATFAYVCFSMCVCVLPYICAIYIMSVCVCVYVRTLPSGRHDPPYLVYPNAWRIGHIRLHTKLTERL